jgi:uncharacterized OsmC-like protein
LTTEIIYTGDLHTQARHVRSGQIFVTDAPIDNQGKGEAFAPTDLMAVSLGSCILTIMGIKARDLGIDITGARAEVFKTMSTSTPRRIARLEVNIYMPSGKYSGRDRRLLVASAHGCPVSESLSKDVEEIIQVIW